MQDVGIRYHLPLQKTLEEVTKEYIVHEIDNAYEKVFTDNEKVFTDNEQMLGTTQFDSIKKQLDEFVITAEIKYGSDGMGEIKVWKEKSEKPLPNKAFHYSICLASCCIDIGNVTYVLFDEDDPSSLHATRNILQAVADENDKSSLATLFHSIDLEIQYLKDKIMSVNVNGENFDF